MKNVFTPRVAVTFFYVVFVLAFLGEVFYDVENSVYNVYAMTLLAVTTIATLFAAFVHKTFADYRDAIFTLTREAHYFKNLAQGRAETIAGYKKMLQGERASRFPMQRNGHNAYRD